MNSFDKFNETKLPKKEDFYSQLYEENITKTTPEQILYGNILT